MTTDPPSARHDRDRALRQIAVVAAAIVVAALAALVGAITSWHALAAGGTDRATDTVGIALAHQGPRLVVNSLGGDGAAARAGLRVGDVVEAVNGARVAGIAAADRAFAARTVDIRVRRGDKDLVIHLSPARSVPLG